MHLTSNLHLTSFKKIKTPHPVIVAINDNACICGILRNLSFYHPIKLKR